MKKVLFISLFCIILSNITFAANNWVLIPSTDDYIYLDENNVPIKNQWKMYDSNKDGLDEFYFFDANGIMMRDRKAPDGSYFNKDGMYEVNGVIQTNSNQKSTTIISETKTNTNSQVVETTANNSNIIITNDDTKSSATSKKELKNNITKKSGVEFVDTKKIDGANWVNTIRFSGNDSFLKADSGNYNELTFQAGLVSLSDNATYLLSIYVNGELLEEYDSEYFNTGDNIVCDFDANSEIMIVYNCQAEEGNYLSQDNKYLYLRNANFKIKN